MKYHSADMSNYHDPDVNTAAAGGDTLIRLHALPQ